MESESDTQAPDPITALIRRIYQRRIVEGNLDGYGYTVRGNLAVPDRKAQALERERAYSVRMGGQPDLVDGSGAW